MFGLGALGGVVVGAILVFAGTVIGAHGHPTRAEWMAFSGAIIGSGLSVIGALIVVEWQAITQRAERRETLEQLLLDLRAAGEGMREENAPRNPVPRVRAADSAYSAAQAVAEELRATSPAIARIAQLLGADPLPTHFARLLVPGIGIAGPDMAARGDETVILADEALAKLDVQS
jgi:hypothetical protein